MPPMLLCWFGILWVGRSHGLRRLIPLLLPTSPEEERGDACDGNGSYDANNDARYCASRQGIGSRVVIGVLSGIRGGY